MIEQLKQLIEQSESILITSHISPDPDALCSVLLLGRTLQKNFPDKNIKMTLEEKPGNLNYLKGYDQVEKQNLASSIDESKPKLIIIVDAMSYSRCTRGDAAAIAMQAKDLDIKLAIIDHHEPNGRDEADVYINQGSPAAVQDVYEVCFEHLGLSKPDGYAETTMTGLYSDSGGFIYENSRYLKTYQIIVELLAQGVNLEKIKANLDQFSENCILALGEIASNITHSNDYSYSYISDEFTDKWEREDKPFEDIHIAIGTFANHFLRNISDRKWGFIVYRDIRAGENIYGVSLRAISGMKDVAVIASSLGGGGHKPAAGAKIKANSATEALGIVKAAVEK